MSLKSLAKEFFKDSLWELAGMGLYLFTQKDISTSKQRGFLKSKGIKPRLTQKAASKQIKNYIEGQQKGEINKLRSETLELEKKLLEEEKRRLLELHERKKKEREQELGLERER